MRLFTEHPEAVGETYGEHLHFATSTGLGMVLGGLACMVHGFLPFLCTSTGSRAIVAAYARLSAGAREERMHGFEADFAGSGD
ncbi:MAG: hypothetical protein HOL85_07815 [Rhodospirillaceae bacterium]|nr:hypothetical protein [Rhodospirillaceae bacterium]MBT6138340.1 hypothetical protein [Rhodospirillaceae bacterium]